MKRIVAVALALALVLTPAALMAQPQVAHAQGQTVHLVKPGETLYGIARMYGVSAQSIATANNLVNPNYIYAGQRLVIPGAYVPPPPPCVQCPPPAGCGTYYQVRPGDTLTAIAVRHGTTVTAIANANGIPYPYDRIYAGQRLYIPCPGGPNPPPPGHKPPPPKPGHPAPKPTARPNLPTAACPREVQIVDPKVGQHIWGTMMIIGTASIPDFQFYKLEYALGHIPMDSDFHSIGDVHRQAVVDGVLGTWYVGHMPANPYTLRLTAVDNRGQFPRPCDVKIFLNQ